MATRRRLDQRFAFASRAVHQHRFRRRPVLEVLEGRVVLATFTVNSPGDAGSGSNGSGDLLYCINQANANDQANTIVFDSTVFGAPQTITLSGSPLELEDSGGTQTIMGPQAGVTISGDGESGVFWVDLGVTATLSDLTITDRLSSVGCKLDNFGTATLTNCSISGNSEFESSALSEVYNFGTATLTNCNISGDSASERYGSGGVYNSGTATLTNCNISGNSASRSFGSGGGLSNRGTATLTNCSIGGNSARYGSGGVYNSGTATLTNCTISGNSTSHGSSGGVANGYRDTATLTNCTISGNQASYGDGGVCNRGTATLTDTIVAGNTGRSSAASDITGTVTGSHNLIGTGGSGGLINGQGGNIVLTSLAGLGLAPLAFYGGPTQTMALLAGSAAIGKGVAVSGVTTDQRGFALDSPIDIGAFQFHSSYSLVVETTSDSGTPAGVFDLRGAVDMADALTGAQTITFDPTVFAKAQTIVLTAGPLVLSQTSGLETITGPQAAVTISGGGTSGVFQVDRGVTASISGLTITDAYSKYSGAGMDNSGTVNLTNCTISGSFAGLGAGVYNSGTATLTNCSISGNLGGSGCGVDNSGTATLTNCTLSGNTGSAGGGVDNSGAATLINCTISGNTAFQYGGGVDNSGTATLIHCTLNGNTATSGGGVYSIGKVTLTDTIVAGNTGPSSAASDITGTVTGTHNLIGTGGSGGLINGQNGNIVLTSLAGLGLAPLAFYGGPTQTMALLPGSAAIGKGVAVSGVTTDQRGFALDSPIDIGAFQFHSSYSLVVKTTSDRGTPAGVFDLREAVDLADVLTGARTITFDPTVFSTAQTIVLTAGPLVLSQTSGLETITGPLAGVTISGGGTNSVVQVNAGTTASLSGLTITDGSNTSGAGVDNSGTVNLTDCAISGNDASNGGGGVYNGGTGTATLTNCTLSGNSVIGSWGTGNGGGLRNRGTATLTNCTLSGNYASAYGGGVDNSGTAILTNCTISGNQAGEDGGGVHDSGTATLTNCTLSGNSTFSGGGGVYIARYGLATTLTNCTISGNYAFNGGGGVYNNGTVNLTNCTISENDANNRGYGVYNSGTGTATFTNTIVAGNTGAGESDVSGDVFSQGHNLVGETDGSFGWVGSDLTGTIASPLDPRLAPLADYGGPTPTMALLPGSPAIGAGVAVSGVTTDQRGFALDNPIDIGAFQTRPLTGKLVVNSTADGSGNQPGKLDLRGAVDLADVLAGAQTITFDPTVFAKAQTIVLTAGPLVLSQTSGLETITGSQAAVTISGGGTSGVLRVDSGVTASISGLMITDGSSTSGGGVDNVGTATFTNCTISGNSASHGGGGVYDGGTGTATLTNCTLSGNSADDGGGVDNSGTATLIHCTISGNQASDVGGGVYNIGKVTLTDTIVAGNTGPSSAASDIDGTVTGSHNLIGTGGSGGLINGQNGNIVLASLTGLGLAPLAFYGGPTQTMALLPGSAAIGKGVAVSGVTTDQRGFALDSPIDIGAFQTRPSTGSLVVNSTADGSGNQPGKLDLRGAVDLADVLPGAQTITFDPTVFATAQTIVLTVGPLVLSQTSGLETITGPQAGVTISGGGTSGVFQVDRGVTASISGLTITGGSSTSGGGVDNVGTVNLTNCTISGNSASAFGGGVDNVGTATLTDCTISRNAAQYGGGVDNVGTATLTNCTISGNQASDGGGGVENIGTATLTNCTINGNKASDGGGGVGNVGNATLTDTIVAGNTGRSSAASDITGTVTGSHNLIGTGGSGGLINGQNGNIVLASLAGLGLAPLAFYGGPTQTMALLPGSAAIGEGIAVSGVTTDQRGLALDSPIDIGAFQTQPSTGSLVVNSTADGSGNQPGKLDLRGAVDLADVLAGAQTITFDPTVFAKAQTIVLTAGSLVLSQTSGLETITGPAARVTISGGGHSRVFQVNRGVTATLSGLTITGGISTSGGGVYNDGTATLTNCIVSGNSAKYAGGVDNGYFGTATLTDCTISGNSASFGGGMDNVGTATLTGCTISRNVAQYGGGVENIGTATLTHCTISGNSAHHVGGGMDIFGGATLTDCTIAGNTAFFGGGLYDGSGTTTLTGCTVSSNTAYTGGGMFNRSSNSTTVDGCTISGNTAYGATGSGGGIFNAASLSVTDSQFDANRSAVFFGGGLENYLGTITLTGCTFSGNTATHGGGASNFGGSLTANGCTLSGNSASFGGGVYNSGTATLSQCNISGNSAQSGGGMKNFGTATLTNCTISGNTAQIGGGAYNVSTGTATLTDCTLNGNSVAGDGGYSSGGALFDQGKATLTNCSIAGNSASESGGGIEAQGTVTVTFSTFSGNQAIYGGAIDNNFGLYTVTLTDTILAGDSATIGPEICNTVTSAGHNLVAETDGSSGWVGSDLAGTVAQPLNALLAVLGKYGGPTETIALLPGSPAIGSGIAVSGVTTDQRGVARPGTGVDIGAFQSRGFTLTPVSGSTPQTALIDTAFTNALGVKVTAKDSGVPVAGGVIAFTAPSSGATAVLSGTTATIGSNGVASVNATANNTAGTYHVTASAAGAAAPASFTLTNTAAAPASITSTSIAHQPAFSGLTNHTIISRTNSITVSGTVVYGGDADFKTSTSAILKQTVKRSAGSSPAVAMGPSVVDQVLAVVQNKREQEVLIGDLAFEQLSGTKPRLS